MNKITTIAVDLAKHVFQVAAEDRLGEELFNDAVKSRDKFMARMREQPRTAEVLLEACPGAQAWARWLVAEGFRVRVLPAQRVAEHRSGAKNDRNDARAILRAGRDRSIHSVAIKTPEQLTMQALHRARKGVSRRWVAVSNQIRGLLLEHGIVIAKGHKALRERLPVLLEDASQPILPRLRELMADLYQDWESLGARIEAMNAEFDGLSRRDPLARRLRTIPGLGAITASALGCKGIDPSTYRSARHFAASYGLVPDQHSTGGKTRLGAMSRRGDRYLRSLLVSGAQAAIRVVRAEASDPHGKRVLRWKARHGTKGAAIRLANRNLRIAWVIMKKAVEFSQHPEADSA